MTKDQKKKAPKPHLLDAPRSPKDSSLQEIENPELPRVPKLAPKAISKAERVSYVALAKEKNIYMKREFLLRKIEKP